MSNTSFRTVNAAVVAPFPSASVNGGNAVNPGDELSSRLQFEVGANLFVGLVIA